MSSTHPILLVEDNPDDRDLTLMAFRDSKLANRIDVARDGQEALEYLADISRPLPALILLDLKLPRVMGWMFSSGCGRTRAPSLFRLSC
jgi:CheY-like chemotaxis protein